MFRGDPSRFRPPSKDFQCYESSIKKDENHFQDEDDEFLLAGKGILFHCTLPPKNHTDRLEFYCREPSCDVLLDGEEEADPEDIEDDGAMDPNFFDSGYTLAGKTGFQVWPGTRLLVEALTFDSQDGDCPKLVDWQNKIETLKVLELGSGVGVVGASLAAAGAQVLLTDLKTLVHHSLWPNLKRNSNLDATSSPPPQWLEASSTKAVLPIGKGWVSATSLDWTVPLTEQLDKATTINEVNVIVACDCVWLMSMMKPLLDTVETLFELKKNKDIKFLMSFQRRDPKTTTAQKMQMFTTVDGIREEMSKRKWNVECLAWRPVNPKAPDKEVFLFEVCPNTIHHDVK